MKTILKIALGVALASVLLFILKLVAVFILALVL